MPAMRDKLRFLSLCKLATIQCRSQARLNSESKTTTHITHTHKPYYEHHN